MLGPTVNSVPAKIVMKGTAQMSLNARFSHYSVPRPDEDRKPPLPLIAPPSSSSTRLAMDMERRPNVMAALKYERSYQEKSVMHRLGAKSRLGYRGGGGIQKWRRGYGRRRFQWRYDNFVRNRFYGRRGGGRGWGRQFGFGYRGRGRGRFPPRGNRPYWNQGRSLMKISKEALDEQLEEYMEHSKNHLDTDLDNYMSGAKLT